MGVLYACTLGLLGMGVLWDLFALPSQVRAANQRIVSEATKYLCSNSAPQAATEKASSRWGFRASAQADEDEGERFAKIIKVLHAIRHSNQTQAPR
jgi:hypothetical protein